MTKRDSLLQELKAKLPADPLRWYDLESIVRQTFDSRGVALVKEFEFWDIVAHYSYWRIYVLLTEDGWEFYDGNFQSLARHRPHPPRDCRIIEYLDGTPYQFACKERIPS